MEAYATKEATAAALVSLGFTRFDDVWFDSPKEDEFGGPVVQCYIYKCSNKYCCVDVSGTVDRFEAPIVWNGPKADWDHANELDEFVAWLDRYNPGWR